MTTNPKGSVRSSPRTVNRSCGHCWGEGHTRASCRLLTLPSAEAMQMTPGGREMNLMARRGLPRDIANALADVPAEAWPGVLAEAIQLAREITQGRVESQRPAAERALARMTSSGATVH